MEQYTADNGIESVFEIRLSPVVIDGAVEMLVGSARDITERKQYERRVESQRDDLQLLNQMVRHDIRNDLQVIQTHGELLAAEVPADLRSSAENVTTSARSAISLREEVRDLAAVMLRSDDIHEPTSLANTLRNQIGQTRSAHEDATIEIDGTIPDVDVLADEMLGSVFDNLLQNSIVHKDGARPRTVVSTTVGDEYATVRVADNGPGISGEQQDQIFEKGEKGTDSGGTGIGLYLVKTLADQYGGSVSIEQPDAESPVDGTVFVVRLPLSE